MADIIIFPAAQMQAPGADSGAASAAEVQLLRLQSTLESWRQILRQLDRVASSSSNAGLAEQSRHIGRLIAAAEQAIAESMKAPAT